MYNNVEYTHTLHLLVEELCVALCMSAAVFMVLSQVCYLSDVFL